MHGGPPDADQARAARGWYSRGYLPHLDGRDTAQVLTFRLADSLPASVVESWRMELRSLMPTAATAELWARAETHLDAGHGKCHLRDPRIAECVEETLLLFDGERYQLHAWVIMPNHVHVLATPMEGHTLSSILHSWKSFTAQRANALLLRRGAFWQREYFDRFIRDERHFHGAVWYIESNPMKAALCGRPEEWRFGSARRR